MMYNNHCNNCQKSFETKYKKTKSCSKVCADELTSKGKIKYNKEDIDNVIRLKKENKTNKQIKEITGVKLDKIKRIVKENNLFLTKEQVTKNTQTGKFIKNPYHMDHMRSSITKESYKQAAITKTETFSDPVYKEMFSDNAKKIWTALRLDPEIYNEYIERRSKTLSETKLGMSTEQYNDILLKIKSEVENKIETVTSAAKKYNISPVTALRRFNELGWDNLINSFTSKAQLDIYNFIKNNYMGEVRLNDWAALSTSELDIFVPELNFGIEYNGLYWHSTANDVYKLGRHVRKALNCRKNDISLLAIYEDEWTNPVKQALIKQMILYRLKVSKFKTVSPRKLEIKILNYNKDYEKFFEQFHIDGYVKSSFAYGAFYQNELIFCASFKTNFNGELEISRLATNYNFSIPGILPKILNLINKPIVSYSNNRLSHGNIYVQTGFKEITKTTNPSYWYTDLKSRVWRFKCKKNNNPEITKLYDSEILQALNGVFSIKLFGDSRPLYKIEDYGHRKWIWEPK